MKTINKLYTALILIFMYAPIAVLILFSFNESNSTSVFSGFSLKWYIELFNDGETLKALYNTLILAVLSSVIATILGTAAAVGIDYMKKGPLRSIIMTITNIPMMNADIVTGVSLMLLFVFIATIFGISGILGFGTLLIAHVTFNLPYVILSVLPKLKQLDPHLTEAAQDLGCTPFQAFLKVVIPNILSGVLTGMIMAFTLSLDDFVISYFASGPEFQTLPLRIFSMTKRRVTPDMYALSTLIFVAILILLLLNNLTKKDESGVKGAKK
ncbi:MAG: ABC transporter permease [Clostridia bacterium]|nr:ABC transporter permease [Clostridia bacterium]